MNLYVSQLTYFALVSLHYLMPVVTVRTWPQTDFRTPSNSYSHTNEEVRLQGRGQPFLQAGRI